MRKSSGREKRKKAIILTGLAGVLWGTSFPAIQLGLNYVDPYTFVFFRFFLASIIMFFIVLVKSRCRFEFGKNRVIWFLGIANGVAYLLQYVGMKSTSASKSSLLVNLSAIWVAILSSLILKEKLGTKRAMGILFGILGVFLITTNLDFKTLGQGAIVGDLLVLLSGVVWAFFTVYNKKLVSNVKDIIQPTTWILFLTLLPLIPSLYFSTSSPLQLPIEAWLAIAYTAVFCWVIPYYLWSEALKSISAVSSTIILLTEVIVALAISPLILPHNSLTLISGIGALSIIVAIILAS
jgi:drug/metabolite transporter (DMT)-like permease